MDRDIVRMEREGDYRLLWFGLTPGRCGSVSKELKFMNW